MAEESSPSSENFPSSHKRRITQNPSLNLTLEFNSSTLELGTSQNQQQTQSFPQQSPKKPKLFSLNHSPTTTTTIDEGCIIDDDNDDDTRNLGKKQLILDDGNVEFQEKGSEIDRLGGENFNFGDKIEVSDLGLVKNDVGIDQKEVNEDLRDEKLNLGDNNEVSDMDFVSNDVGVDQKEVIEDLSGEKLNLDYKIEVSDMGFVRNDVGVDQKEVIEDLSGEKVNLGDKIEVSDMGFVRNDVGFVQKETSDEFLGVKDETVEFGCDKKDENAENSDGVLPKMVKIEDSASSSLMIEVMDGTALVDVSLVEDKRNRKRANNHNCNHKKSNSRNNGVVSEVSKEGKKKCVYSRKELEVLRYVNVKGQRKFWQEIYDGFSATVKKEYDEVGSFRHHKHGVPSSDYHKNGGMRNCKNGGIMGTCSIGPNYNNRGILGVAAARGRCNNPNNFVYKRKRIANCEA